MLSFPCHYFPKTAFLSLIAKIFLCTSFTLYGDSMVLQLCFISYSEFFLQTYQRYPTVFTHKVAFLMTITSARRVSGLAALCFKEPLLMLHKDKVVLRLKTSIFARAVSSFHHNQDIVLSLCPALKHFFPLSGWGMNSASFPLSYGCFQLNSLFVIPVGSHKGHPASCSIIDTWIRQFINMAYSLQTKVIPIPVKAYPFRSSRGDLL